MNTVKASALLFLSDTENGLGRQVSLGEDMDAESIKNGTLKLLTTEQVQYLLDRMGDRPSMRRAYLKLACLAVLKWDAEGRYLNATQISDIARKYLTKNTGITPQQVGTLMGTLSRMKIVNRSYNRPHTYWWRD